MIACVRIPYFAATVFFSCHPDSTQKPLILAQYKGRRGLVHAACEGAVKCDVKPKMSVSRARALCPEAAIEMASPAQARRALESLMLILSDYSQWIEAKIKAGDNLTATRKTMAQYDKDLDPEYKEQLHAAIEEVEKVLETENP
ncbi:MAG: hypothetical protein ABI970_26085, partial [Chloroflexota bacterium]